MEMEVEGAKSGPIVSHQLLQEGMALMVQTLQAVSYSGTFIWKIPEVQRRRGEARSGRTVSLYSAPFYTGRHGYKMCLRLYMDEDGSGRGKESWADCQPTASRRFWRDGFDGANFAGNLLQWNIHLEDPRGAEKER